MDIERIFFGLLSKNIRWGCKNCFLSVHRMTLRKKYFFETIKFFLSLSDLERKVFGLLAKIFQQVCQNCILQDHKKTREENFLKVFLIIVRFCAENFRLFFRKIHRVCQTQFYEYRRTLWDNLIHYFVRSLTFRSFLSGKFSPLWENLLGRFVKIAF